MSNIPFDKSNNMDSKGSATKVAEPLRHYNFTHYPLSGP